LNEKRAEVIKIETRFKVNVLMVPNKHLETPHYKLERLRHDDPRLDDQKASYVMAEEAARELETDTTVSKKDADVKVRPEAAVKGITPTQPAPISQPRPARTETVKAESTGGFFGFIKSLFGSSPAVEEQSAPINTRGRNQGRNGGASGDRNRGRNRRGERTERTERPAANAAEGTPAEGTNNVRNRNNRNGNRNQGNQNGPKPERQATPAAVTPATEAALGSDATPSADTEERRGRGRNRRGRGRGQRGDRTENGDAATAVSTTSSASPFAGPPVGMAGSSATMPMQNLANSFGNAKPAAEKQGRPERAPRTPRQSNRPVQNSAQASAPAANPTTAPAPVAAAPKLEVIAKPVPELPKVAFQALEETPLHSVVQSAGMIWVATDSSKHAEAQSQIQAEPMVHNLGRAPKPAASIPEGPMVLVETGGQEKTV
jgi:ribonuclease E